MAAEALSGLTDIQNTSQLVQHSGDDQSVATKTSTTNFKLNVNYHLTTGNPIGSCGKLMFHPYDEESVPSLGMSFLSPMHTTLTENNEQKQNSKMNTMHHYLLSLVK